jgi:peptide/nickel transport system permease protein
MSATGDSAPLGDTGDIPMGEAPRPYDSTVLLRTWSILSFVVTRLALAAATLLAVSLLIFVGTEILPGDVAQAILGQGATPLIVANLRRALGLDLPAYVRYLDWLGSLLHGDLGVSLTTRRPVIEMIGTRVGNTLFLASVAAVVAVPLAIFLGLVAARYRNSWIDRAISISTLATISMPEFFVGYMLIYVVAVQLHWLPSIAQVLPGMALGTRLRIVILPAATLVLVVVAHMMRMTRAALIAVLAAPYIETAELKGITPLRIILWHALPNALSPIITIVMLNLAYLVVGIVLVEVVFVYPGVGQLMVDAVAKRDVPVIQACGLIFAGTYVFLNVLADLLSTAANPRLRHPK